MKKVLCFGELLLRLSPELKGEWLRKHSMPFYLGGAELNTATALAKWGLPVDYCTALPPNALSEEIISLLMEKNIGTNSIRISGNRIGCYYLPQGTDLKHTGVIYDRNFSSFSGLRPGDINWDEVFKGISWFHFSAISPALSEHLAALCKEALEAASQKGITISVDLNYRARLWQYGKHPAEVMPELVRYCSVIMGNIWAIEKMLAIPVGKVDAKGYTDYLLQAETSSVEIMRQYPKSRQVANTFRFDESEGVRYYATLLDTSGISVSRELHSEKIVDKVGSGDVFMAALIYGNIHSLPARQLVDLATAAAFDKLFILGDATTSSIEEIKKGYLNYV